MQQTAIRSEVMKWLKAHEQEMLRLLEEVVNIDSGSTNKAGVDQVAATFRSHLERAGIATELFAHENNGNCLLATVPGSAGATAPHVLLLGHMDTVFPQGTASKRPFRAAGGMAYGPGVADMKGGLVMNTFLARAFAEVGGNKAPIRVFYTGDEEIASPSSAELIRQMAQGAATVLNAEPGRPSGNVVVARKGGLFIDFEVEGVPAHSGANHEKGASAIDALARKILRLHELTDRTSGVTANVGTVCGGVTVNIVAPHATAQLDVRFPIEVDREGLRRRIVEIIEEPMPPRTRGRIAQERRFLPLSQTDASRDLLATYVRAAKEVGFDVSGEFTGGCADSGTTAATGAPTLCATGPVGGEVHTPDEYCRIDTLVPRAQAAALTILARDGA